MAAVDHDRLQLLRRGQPMQRIPHPGARRQRREKGLDLVLGGQHDLPQVQRDQRRQRSWLSGVCARFDLLRKARHSSFPDSGSAVRLRDRQHAQMLPKLAERAQNRRLGQAFSQLPGKISRCARTTLGQKRKRVGRERRYLDRSRVGWRLLPELVATQGEDVRKYGSRDDKIGVLARCAWRAKQVERNRGAVSDQPRQQRASVCCVRERRRALWATECRLHDGRPRHSRELRTRGVQQQARALHELTQRIEREQPMGCRRRWGIRLCCGLAGDVCRRRGCGLRLGLMPAKPAFSLDLLGCRDVWGTQGGHCLSGEGAALLPLHRW